MAKIRKTKEQRNIESKLRELGRSPREEKKKRCHRPRDQTVQFGNFIEASRREGIWGKRETKMAKD